MDWQALAKAVVARRIELGMRRQQDLAERAELTRRVLSDIEHARRDNYDRVTLARVETALQWADGSAEAVLKGGEPVPLEGNAPGSALDPRSLERYGDDMELMQIINGARLSPGDALRVALWARGRRADLHQLLVEELRLVVDGLEDGRLSSDDIRELTSKVGVESLFLPSLRDLLEKADEESDRRAIHRRRPTRGGNAVGHVADTP